MVDSCRMLLFLESRVTMELDFLTFQASGVNASAD